MLGVRSASALLFMVVCTVSLDLSQIQVHPENAKVFLAMLKHKQYSFNATTATAVCSALNVTVASRAQVESAMNNGFQTCRYGWIMEKVAVIPRIEKNPLCGQNRVGILTWRTDLSRQFEVFCFNSSGQTDERTIVTTESDLRPLATTTSSLLITFLNKSSTSVSRTSSAVSTSTPSTRLSPTKPFRAGYQPSTSSSTSSTLSKSTSSSHLMTSSSSPTQLSDQIHLRSTARTSLGAVPLTCVIIAAMLLLMAGLGTVWYFKIKLSHRLPPWIRMRHKDALETEMWRQSDNKMYADDAVLQLDEYGQPA